MSTELLLFIEIICTFSVIVIVNRFFKKEGVVAWIAIASILANLFTVKSSLLFGNVNLGYTQGTVLFASTFLATDILTELYGKEVAKKGVFIGMGATLFFLVSSQFTLLSSAAPWSSEAQSSLEIIFSTSFRISLSSVVMYFIANLLDVYLYDALRKKMDGKHMWIRNNVATILCNCLENFFFMFGAFLGVEGYSVTTIAEMALVTSAVEVVIGLCDTPFLYLATKFHKD